MKNKILLFSISLLFFACEKAESPVPQVIENLDVVILNEGNFRSGNSSISLYGNTGVVTDKVFQSNNNGRPLGDVAHSMIQHNDKLYIVVNNSNKIEVVGIQDFKSVGSIQGLNSPRYILPVGGNKAYVSDLYEDKINVIDLESLALLKQIETKGWTEEMVLVQNEAFVCQVDSNQVWVIDVNTDSVLTKINTGISPQSIVKDINDNVWVSCSGGFGLGFPTLIQINSNSKQEIKRLEILDLNRSMGSLKTNRNGDELYYLSQDIYKLSINDTVLPINSFISSNNRTFYDFGMEPDFDQFYVADAIDYQQSGIIYQYNSLGQEIGNFRVGLIPGFIHFIK